MIEATNLEGTKIRDTLFDGVTRAGHVRRQVRRPELRPHRLRAVVLGLAVRGERLDPAEDLGRGARAGRQGQGEGQVPVRLGQGGGDLLPDAGHRVGDQGGRRRGPAGAGEPQAGLLVACRPCRACSPRMKKIIDAGYFKPGGSGTQFTAAQAQWSNDAGRAALPVGLVDRERDEGPDQGGLQDDRRCRADGHRRQHDAVRGAAQRGRRAVRRPVARARTSPAARSCSGSCCRKEAATNFAKTKLAPTIVKGTVPADGFGSTALVSQTKMLEAAGSNIFSWQFVDYYGMNPDQLVVVEHLPGRQVRRRRPDQGSAGDHRQGGERQLGQEDRDQVTAAVTQLQPGRGDTVPARRRRGGGTGRSTTSASCWSSSACRWPSTWSSSSRRSCRPCYYSLTDWIGLHPHPELRRAGATSRGSSPTTSS